MRSKWRLVFYVLLLSFLFSTAQSQTLNIGDTVPDLLSKLSSYADKKLAPSDLKGKFIILDFWSHVCIVCLRSFPEMDSLQKEFHDKLQVFLVNGESKAATDSMFARRKKLKKPDLPIISGDPFFHKYFPHTSVPMHVWIDSSAVVRYVTEGESTNRETIQSFIGGGSAYVANFSATFVPSLFDTAWLRSLKFFSYISQCINNVQVTSTSKQGYSELIVNCASVKDLYRTAYKEGKDLYYFHRPGRILFEVSDSTLYLNLKTLPLKEREKYSYNYHLLLPANREAEKYTIMRNDLDRYFNLKAAMEVRKTTCLVLTRTSTNDKLKTKGGKQILNFYAADERTERYDSIRNYTNTPYLFFSTSLQTYIENAFAMPFVDATGYNENIDFKIKASVLDAKNLSLFKKELLKYDLNLVEMEWPLEALVIRDN